MSEIQNLKKLAETLASLMKRPEPGLKAWQRQVRSVLEQITDLYNNAKQRTEQ